MNDLRGRAAVRASILAAVCLLACAGCKAKSEASWIDDAPFDEAVGPATYVPKVKFLMTGLAASDADVAAVKKDPDALRGLVDVWMKTPEFQARMLDFFRNAFQQNNVSLDAVSSSLEIPDFYLPWEQRRRLEQTFMDSFPRTAWQLVQEGRPFNETITTRRTMMTTAMMAALLYTDMFDVNDVGDREERLSRVASLQMVFDPTAAHADGTPITTAESVAAFKAGKSGDWVWRIPMQNVTQACLDELRTRRSTEPTYGMDLPEWDPTPTLLGLVFGATGPYDLVANSACEADGGAGTNVVVPLLRDDAQVHDWDDWRMVTLEQVPLAERDTLPSPAFWDVPALRAATTIRLKAPRIGFLGTLAWNANWATNASNQARVVANQALIVSVGESIIPAGAIAPAPVSASDIAHSADPACAACHKVLDPLRQFFRQSYTLNFHEQRDLSQYLGSAAFLLDGMNEPGRGVEDLTRILANHPHFAVGWVQKLQFWANSTAASEADPEVVHLADLFRRSRYDFRVLAREVFTSPLVTLARGTQTYRDQGVVVGMARRDQLCAALSVRLGQPDICHQRTADADWSAVNQAGQMIATDVYYRAAELPSLPRDPDLFFRDGVEAVCAEIAYDVVDQDGSRYASDTAATVKKAIDDMVANLMGLPPSDARAAAATKILTDNFAAASAANVWRTQALRSTFTLACMSPSSALVGL